MKAISNYLISTLMFLCGGGFAFFVHDETKWVNIALAFYFMLLAIIVMLIQIRINKPIKKRI
jgi:hypothetical protein